MSLRGLGGLPTPALQTAAQAATASLVPTSGSGSASGSTSSSLSHLASVAAGTTSATWSNRAKEIVQLIATEIEFLGKSQLPNQDGARFSLPLSGKSFKTWSASGTGSSGSAGGDVNQSSKDDSVKLSELATGRRFSESSTNLGASSTAGRSSRTSMGSGPASVPTPTPLHPLSSTSLSSEISLARLQAPGNPRWEDYAKDRAVQLARLEAEIDLLVKDFSFASYLISASFKQDTLLTGVNAVSAISASSRMTQFLKPSLSAADGEFVELVGGGGTSPADSRSAGDVVTSFEPSLLAPSASSTRSSVSSAPHITYQPEPCTPAYLLPPSLLPPTTIPHHPTVEKLFTDLFLIFSSLPPSAPQTPPAQSSPNDTSLHLSQDRRVPFFARCLARLAPVLDPHSVARAYWHPLVSPGLHARWTALRAAAEELAEAMAEICETGMEAISKADEQSGVAVATAERRDLAKRYFGIVGTCVRATLVWTVVEAAKEGLGESKTLSDGGEPFSNGSTTPPMSTRVHNRTPTPNSVFDPAAVTSSPRQSLDVVETEDAIAAAMADHVVPVASSSQFPSPDVSPARPPAGSGSYRSASPGGSSSSGDERPVTPSGWIGGGGPFNVARRVTAGDTRLAHGDTGTGAALLANVGSRLRLASASKSGVQGTGTPVVRAAPSASPMSSSYSGGGVFGGIGGVGVDTVPVTVEGAMRIAEALRGEAARGSVQLSASGDRRGKRAVDPPVVGSGPRPSESLAGILAAELGVEAWMRRVHLAWIARLGSMQKEVDEGAEVESLRSRIATLESTLAHMTSLHTSLSSTLDAVRAAHADTVSASRERVEVAERERDQKVRDAERFKKRFALEAKERNRVEKELMEANARIFKLQTTTAVLETSSSALEASERLVQQLTSELLMWEDDHKVARKALQKCDELEAELRVTQRALASMEKVAAERERAVNERSKQLSQTNTRLADVLDHSRKKEQVVQKQKTELRTLAAISEERTKALQEHLAWAKGINSELETIILDLRARLEIAEGTLARYETPNFDKATVSFREGTTGGENFRHVHLWTNDTIEFTLELPVEWDNKTAGDAVARWVAANGFVVAPYVWSTVYNGIDVGSSDVGMDQAAALCGKRVVAREEMTKFDKALATPDIVVSTRGNESLSPISPVGLGRYGI
ncbi:hypothetical protein HDU93_008388 [Gonapodya sp. JEL0774]|nr:hypothetical protein HDU93_008388 [Gonapodya sp. JEL0774]